MKDVEERFKKIVVEHEMIVVRDDGLHRHLTFKSPRTFAYHFHITTWPGYLAISGDMGCYVFARLPDMFQFFRGSRINPSYWAEKLQACDKTGGVKEFSEDLFHAAIKSDFEQWEFEDDAQKTKAWEELQDSDLSEESCPDSLEHAIRTAMAYKCPVTRHTFGDFWDHNLQDYTFHFLWCCHAIRWAIAEVDRRRTSLHLSQMQRPSPSDGADASIPDQSPRG